PNDVVYSVQDDKNDNLWLGTNNGIVCFDPDNEKFTHYGVKDGIQSKEFNIHAKYRDLDGRVYLGGVGGITYFDPPDLIGLDGPQPLYFSQLRVKDQEITPSSNGQVLEKALQRTDEIQIQKNQFPFYLQFSTIDFRTHKNIDFAYKLLPIDKDWNKLKNPEIQFLNLPSGNYTLLVNGFSRGIPWSNPPLKMEIGILPPWYATWWAFVLYALLFGLVLYLLYHFQLSKKMVLAESKRLREINQLKNSLYTNITHEFRTPLTVILGMVDVLRTNKVANGSQADQKSLGLIERNGNKLLQLVNEMLDLAKLESGRMELQTISADVVLFVKYLSQSFHPLADSSNTKLVVYPEIDELIMDFDPTKLSAIVSNLLSNAIKFTPKDGNIVVHINQTKFKGQVHLQVKIKDSGIGISEEILPYIFDRFYQVGNNASHYKGGTGIGLSLTKELVELMGGEITAKSMIGKGSEFLVKLPVKKTKEDITEAYKPIEPNPTITLADQQELDWSNPKEDEELPLVLIIEDSLDVAHYLKICLEGKYRSMHAENGTIGSEMAFEHIPDAIICDILMPGKDGLEVCATLKIDNRTDHIPIILLTAKVSAKNRLSGLSHGADAYLAKPFNIAELHIRLNQLIRLRGRLVKSIGDNGITKFLKSKARDPETIFLQKALSIIRDEIDNDGFGPLQLARKLHLSKSQLYRKLKAITGKSTAIFIRSVRLEEAKELLQTTTKTISEVAYEMGFSNPSWFSRAFKEEFGYPPSAIHK
ncbi:MAG TPA: ATP-binding protein, partial [Allomuricauda sp.]|nr:ATP-binding protein [Allomuricauda sp.]